MVKPFILVLALASSLDFPILPVFVRRRRLPFLLALEFGPTLRHNCLGKLNDPVRVNCDLWPRLNIGIFVSTWGLLLLPEPILNGPVPGPVWPPFLTSLPRKSLCRIQESVSVADSSPHVISLAMWLS
eukprot:s239_g18.t1